MMAGNPNWWSMNGMHPQSHHQFIYDASNSPINSNPSPPSEHHLHHPNPNHLDHFPVRSWSQLLMGGCEEERFGASLFQQQKKVDNWEEQVMLNLNHSSSSSSFSTSNIPDHVKQEEYGHVVDDAHHNQFQTNTSNWPRHHHHHPALIPVSSPTSSVTTSTNTIFNFSAAAKSSSAHAAAQRKNQHHSQDHSSECNSTSTGGVSKKARVQQSSAQPALKVRKEKLGDRITALHQLVSPFGKTDTASVLSEAIGYIRFLQGQIEALSSPYMRNAAAGNTAHHQHSVQERNCLFPEEPTQFLNDIAMEGRGASKQDSQGRSGMKDLRSRGLCLVPISCTQHVGNENGADYWAPAAFGGGF